MLVFSHSLNVKQPMKHLVLWDLLQPSYHFIFVNLLSNISHEFTGYIEAINRPYLRTHDAMDPHSKDFHHGSRALLMARGS